MLRVASQFPGLGLALGLGPAGGLNLALFPCGQAGVSQEVQSAASSFGPIGDIAQLQPGRQQKSLPR